VGEIGLAERPAALSANTRFVRYWLPVLMYVGLILTLSAQPNLRPPLHLAFGDKISHVLEYFGLGTLLARAVRAGRGAASTRAFMTAIALGVMVGIGDEILQSFVPGRVSDVFDVLADASGVLLAQIVFRLAVRE
jgi:VanZ family protein